MTRDEAIFYALQQAGWLSTMHKIEEFQDQIGKIKAALLSKDFAVVPMEATEDMLDAAIHVERPDTGRRKMTVGELLRLEYRAMVKAVG